MLIHHNIVNHVFIDKQFQSEIGLVLGQNSNQGCSKLLKRGAKQNSI